MKIENTSSNITSLSDYRKAKKASKTKPTGPQKPLTPAGITKFEVISSLHHSPQEKMTPDEVKAILDPDGYHTPKKQNNAQETARFSLSAPIVDFSVLSSLYPNIKKSQESELIEFFLMEGYALTYEQASAAIEKYKQDAIELRPYFEKINQIRREFEDRIKNVDLSSLDKIRSMYELKDKREMLANYETPDSFIPSKKSSKVTKNIAKLYVRQLQDLLPEYDIEVEDDKTSDVTNNTIQISVSKDNYHMVFFFNDFVSAIKRKSIGENVQCYIESKGGVYDWHYDGPEGILNKINKIFRGAIGAVSKDAYNEKGEPEFYIDTNFDSGPAYYALMETLRMPTTESDINIDDTGDMTEEEIAVVKDMVEDPEINKYYKRYGLLFVNSCIRNGNFNLGVAMAQAQLLDLGQCFSMEGEISLDYAKSIIEHVEEKDNDYYIDDDVFYVANSFLVKELNSKEDHHELIYAVLDYVREHQSERTYDFAENLADEMFNFEEVKSVMDILRTSNSKKQGVIMQKLNRLVRAFDESGAIKPDIRMYDQLMHELHLN